jgi:hypothetical protein
MKVQNSQDQLLTLKVKLELKEAIDVSVMFSFWFGFLFFLILSEEMQVVDIVDVILRP